MTPTPAPAQLVINEVDYAQPGADDAEFIEILNVGGAGVNLGTHDIVLVDGAGGGAVVYDVIDLPAITLPPGAFFVVCGSMVTVPDCDLAHAPMVDFIQDGNPDAVALVFDDSTAAVAAGEHLATVVDTVSYGGNTGAPYTEGSGVGLLDDGTIEGVSLSRFPNGLDTDQNNIDFSQRCSSPGQRNRSLVAGCDAPPPVGGFEVGSLELRAEPAGREVPDDRGALPAAIASLLAALLGGAAVAGTRRRRVGSSSR